MKTIFRIAYVRFNGQIESLFNVDFDTYQDAEAWLLKEAGSIDTSFLPGNHYQIQKYYVVI